MPGDRTMKHEEAEKQVEGAQREEASEQQETDGSDDKKRDRNDSQVKASLRTLENNEDDDDAGSYHGHLGSSDAEQRLEGTPVGTWILRIDPGLKGMWLSVREGPDTIGHHRTDADSTDAVVLRYRVRRELMLPLPRRGG